MASLAGAAVAMIILADLATGQGPPVYTNYLRAQQDLRPPPPPMQQVAYMKPGIYDSPGLDKEYVKAVDEKEDKRYKEGEYKEGSRKHAKDKAKGEHEEKYYKDDTTPAPGSSFYNRIMKSFG